MSVPEAKLWKPHEDEVITKWYGLVGAKGIHELGLLPGRSYAAIRNKVMEFDLPPSPIVGNGQHRVERKQRVEIK
jgi:hypothetical protein